MLTVLAARDSPVELMPRDEDKPTVSLRCRLFEVSGDGGVVVERPRHMFDADPFRCGDELYLVLTHNNARLVGTCRLLDTHMRQVNASLRLPCYRLSAASRPQVYQRRSFFRVGVAAADLEPADLQSTDPDKPLRFRARLVNLSAGGLGVSIRASRELLNQIKRTRHLHCDAAILGQAISAPVGVTYVSPLGDDGLYLGVEFRHEDPTEQRDLQDLMQHLCTQFQRDQLRKRRRA